MTPNEQRMMQVIDENREKVHKIAKKIWEFKEVGWEEFQSSALLENALEKEGFEVQRGLVGKHPKFDQEIDMPTAFKAVYKGKEGGPVIGLMLEYDALPNGHACGHNLIAASGYMDEVDLMLANHYGGNWGSEVTGKAIVWPTHDNWLTFKGRTAHASSAPEQGRSALDAVLLTCTALEYLREHMVETNRIHYIISKGETTAIYKWDAPWYCATPVPSLYHNAADYAADLGIDSSRFTFGNLPKASSDLGSVAYKLPTVEITFPIVPDGEPVPVGHADETALLTCQDYPIDQCILASKLMALTGLRIAGDPEKLSALKAEFAKNYRE